MINWFDNINETASYGRRSSDVEVTLRKHTNLLWSKESYDSYEQFGLVFKVGS